MSEFLRCCLILLGTLLSVLSADAETSSKYCCQGDYLLLFQNITFHKGNSVNLYINGLRRTLIATWHSLQNPSILPGYKEKVFLDDSGTISIRNIQISDEAKYVLSYDADNTKYEVQIYVMVPPNRHCKPKIKITDSLLSASLEAEDCGRPQASVHWLDYPEISIVGKDVIKLPPEKEAGTYYACTESPALQCVKNLRPSDYCTTITVQEKAPRQRTEAELGKDRDNRSPPVPELSDIKTVTFVTVTLVSVIIFAVPITAIIMLQLRRKKLPDVVLAEDAKANLKTKTNVEMNPLLNDNSDALVDGKMVDMMKSQQITVHIQADADQRKSIFDVFKGQYK